MENNIKYTDKKDIITIRLIDYPVLMQKKEEELREQGWSEEEIMRVLPKWEIELELFYHKGYGLFGVESDAVGDFDLNSPYNPEVKLEEETE